ncbi:hypothetical protein M1D52_09415 [Olivibacter sp. SA151]|uniref:hypothetical protein n=1 Tax=Olivibacter jilunii TaxID=985016 RepID=UPI003F15D0F9
MNFQELIDHEITNLPLSHQGGFIWELESKFEAFAELIGHSHKLNKIAKRFGNFNNLTFTNRVNIIRKGIIDTLKAYYEGNPSKAYALLSSFMKKAGVNELLNKENFINEGTSFFRARSLSGSSELNNLDLFHIPFHLRTRVQSQRFSIPGLPSLYLANSIYVVWEELGRPSLNDLYSVKICNTRTLQLLDLTTDIFSGKYLPHFNPMVGIYYTTLWPLIAACSVKVFCPDDPFKPEYIIPQLLLQWVNKSNIDGIKYSSTKINLVRSQHKGVFYNIVIPTRSNLLREGYCPQLLERFHSTQVLSPETRDILSPNDRWPDQETITADVNCEIEEIEINGRPQAYHRTTFGIMEHLLNHMELEGFNL